MVGRRPLIAGYSDMVERDKRIDLPQILHNTRESPKMFASFVQAMAAALFGDLSRPARYWTRTRRFNNGTINLSEYCMIFNKVNRTRVYV